MFKFFCCGSKSSKLKPVEKNDEIRTNKSTLLEKSKTFDLKSKSIHVRSETQFIFERNERRLKTTNPKKNKKHPLADYSYPRVSNSDFEDFKD